MEANGVFDGSGEMTPGRVVLEGTDLDIAHDMQGDDLVMRVNKAGVLVFRDLLVDAASAGMAEPVAEPRRGLIRWLLGR